MVSLHASNPQQHDLKFNRQFFKDLWQLLKPYWQSSEKKTAWSLLGLVIACVLGEVISGVGYNYFYKFFYDALQDMDKHAILYAIAYFLMIRALLTLSISGSVYFNGLLSIRWRRWLTTQYLKNYLHQHNHYHLQQANVSIDNPDQRISDDLEIFSTLTLRLFFGPWMLLQALLYLVSFGYILWQLSKSFIFHLQTFTFNIPGYLFWTALLYAVIGTWTINWIGRKLSGLDYEQQHLNADFRFSLIRLREASEQIALQRGEGAEAEKFQKIFGRIFQNFIKINRLKTRLSLFDNAYKYIAYILGFAISLPFYLAEAFKLGVVMQVSSAYGAVISGFSTFVDSFDDFATWRSIIHRLSELNRSTEKLIHQEKLILIQHHDEDKMIVKNLTITLPRGKTLVSGMHLDISWGQRILITGPSGIGKSTLLRALAGIWTFGEGCIHFPAQSKQLFLPQKPYLPLGTLKDLLCYPHDVISDEKAIEILARCALEKLAPQLHEIKPWPHTLSLGEQQLIAFARLFIAEPNIIFLDEATASLDENTERMLYQQLKQHLPQATIITVGHRSSLFEFHDEVIHLSDNAERALITQVQSNQKYAILL